MYIHPPKSTRHGANIKTTSSVGFDAERPAIGGMYAAIGGYANRKAPTFLCRKLRNN